MSPRQPVKIDCARGWPRSTVHASERTTIVNISMDSRRLGAGPKAALRHPMNRRRFATVSSKPGPLAGPALSTRLTDRLPLDVAISLSVEVLEAVAAVHQQQRVLGAFGASELTVLADGSVAVLSASKPGDDLSLDSFSVGTVLYQVFTGLTPNQARARCADTISEMSSKTTKRLSSGRMAPRATSMRD